MTKLEELIEVGLQFTGFIVVKTKGRKKKKEGKVRIVPRMIFYLKDGKKSKMQKTVQDKYYTQEKKGERRKKKEDR